MPQVTTVFLRNGAMIKYLGRDEVDRCIFSVRFEPGCTENVPWGERPFDCAVLTFDAQRLREQCAAICEFLVDADTGWISTAGREAQWLHDEIDIASVAFGRQEAVGNGSPMTAWDDEATDASAMVKYALTLGDGHDNVLVIVVGSDDDYGLIESEIRARLTDTIV